MATTTLYKKQFPQDDSIEDLLKQSFEDNPVRQDITCVPIPDRQQGCVEFIQTAISLSEQHRLDITVLHHNAYIEAVISFDSGQKMKYLKNLFKLADDYSFFAHLYDRDITMSLYYYTHELRLSGEVIAP